MKYRTYREYFNEKLKDPELKQIYDDTKEERQAFLDETRKEIEQANTMKYLKQKAKENISEKFSKEELDRALQLVGTYAENNNIKISFSRKKTTK